MNFWKKQIYSVGVSDSELNWIDFNERKLRFLSDTIKLFYNRSRTKHTGVWFSWNLYWASEKVIIELIWFCSDLHSLNIDFWCLRLNWLRSVVLRTWYCKYSVHSTQFISIIHSKQHSFQPSKFSYLFQTTHLWLRNNSIHFSFES